MVREFENKVDNTPEMVGCAECVTSNAFSLQEIMRKDWMFKLVGKEHFKLGKAQASCCISIDAVSGFAYEYTIEVSHHLGECIAWVPGKLSQCIKQCTTNHGE